MEKERPPDNTKDFSEVYTLLSLIAPHTAESNDTVCALVDHAVHYLGRAKPNGTGELSEFSDLSVLTQLASPPTSTPPLVITASLNNRTVVYLEALRLVASWQEGKSLSAEHLRVLASALFMATANPRLLHRDRTSYANSLLTKTVRQSLKEDQTLLRLGYALALSIRTKRMKLLGELESIVSPLRSKLVHLSVQLSLPPPGLLRILALLRLARQMLTCLITHPKSSPICLLIQSYLLMDNPTPLHDSIFTNPAHTNPISNLRHTLTQWLDQEETLANLTNHTTPNPIQPNTTPIQPHSTQPHLTQLHPTPSNPPNIMPTIAQTHRLLEIAKNTQTTFKALNTAFNELAQIPFLSDLLQNHQPYPHNSTDLFHMIEKALVAPNYTTTTSHTNTTTHTNTTPHTNYWQHIIQSGLEPVLQHFFPPDLVTYAGFLLFQQGFLTTPSCQTSITLYYAHQDNFLFPTLQQFLQIQFTALTDLQQELNNPILSTSLHQINQRLNYPPLTHLLNEPLNQTIETIISTFTHYTNNPDHPYNHTILTTQISHLTHLAQILTKDTPDLSQPTTISLPLFKALLLSQASSATTSSSTPNKSTKSTKYTKYTKYTIH
ncbi:hypothetical protein NEHOM01_0831 [Nematocida homosporus]|uniref:uncharacterized protein n=1 Tax=Nematocida homosporus TaxID=1912981 RepID=UPI00221F962F|nr:uncharacterized protein NEHOM01_0831 [Nematocida homosporus]KAI5185416.1 hypothetical protein NEHOM01_0831 [Nematocida homosporus]